MDVYLNLLKKVLSQGKSKDDRTGTGVRSLFGEQLKFDLTSTIPIITTKKIHLKSIVHELLWFIAGRTDVAYLQEHGITIWDKWAEAGELGSIYGAQWRHWGEQSNGKDIDQISKVLKALRDDPFSRRHVVSAWNVSELDSMSLTPCHCLFQFYVTPDQEGKPAGISTHLYQRSADLFLGVPFNITSYALLTYMFGQVLGYKPQELIISFGDVHLYNNHVEQAEEQLSREPLGQLRSNGVKQHHTLELNNDVKNLFDFRYEDIKVSNYQSLDPIKAPISV